MAVRRSQSVTVPSSRVSRERRSPGLRSAFLKNARFMCFLFIFFFSLPQSLLFSEGLEVSRGFQRFSEAEVFRDFLETLSEADFPLRGSQTCCPSSCCPLIFLQVAIAIAIAISIATGTIASDCFLVKQLCPKKARYSAIICYLLRSKDAGDCDGFCDGIPLGTEKYLPPPPREQKKKIFRGKLWLHPPLR